MKTLTIKESTTSKIQKGFKKCIDRATLCFVSVQEWQTGINQKLEPFLQEKESLKDEEVAQLGKKDPEAYP